MSTSAPEMTKQQVQQADQQVTSSIQHLRQELDRIETQSRQQFDSITGGYGPGSSPADPSTILEVHAIKERANEFARSISEKADRLLLSTYQQQSSQSSQPPVPSGVFYLVRQVLDMNEQLWQRVKQSWESQSSK